MATPEQQANQVRPRTLEALRETRPWVSLLSGLGMFAGGIGLLGGGFAVLRMMKAGGNFGELLQALPPFLKAAAYSAAAVLLRRYVSAIDDLLVSRHAHQLDVAMEAQKTFWRLSGIAVAAVLILLCAGFLFLMIAGGASAALG